MVMMFHVDFLLLLADGYNLLMGICSAPLSTSCTNMSRSERAVQKTQSDLEINLFFFFFFSSLALQLPACSLAEPINIHVCRWTVIT